MMEKKVFSDEEQIRRVWDVEDVKTLMHQRVYFGAADDRQGELDQLWVSDPNLKKTASYGSNWGYYVGMDAIKAWYVDAHEERLLAQMKANGGEKNQGNLYIHPVSTGVVELAEDGKTAKGLWYSIGQETIANGDGTAHARWMLGKIAADFVKEDDGWKFWHIVVSTDVDCEAGKDYGIYPVYEDWSANSTNPVRREFGTPTIEKLVHDVTFNWWDNYPPMPPKGYKTMTDEVSYGPEGYRPPDVIGMRAGEGRNYK